MRSGAKTSDREFMVFVAIAAALLALRVATLIASPLDLHFDEAQYWWWGKNLDWGYFSKPPLIGWAIAGSTALFGDAPWAVRLVSPIAHTLGAFALYALAHRAYSPMAGLWAGVGWLLMPGVQFSTAVISTDALLLPLWSAALFALYRFIETRDWRWAAALGAAAGLGMLAKYAMGYFPLCAAIAAIWSKPVRQALFSREGLVAWAAALIVVAPNAVWNATHRFATVSHTAANASLDQALIHPDEAWDFLASQAGVVGPILLIALLILVFHAARAPARLDDRDKFLLAFTLPPLIIILGQALLVRAHANWAAAAYPAAILWLAGQLSETRPGRVALISSAALHAVLGAILAVALVAPTTVDAFSNKRPRGLREAWAWQETADLVRNAARDVSRAGPVTAILVDDRSMFFELAYHWREDGPPAPLRMWVIGDAPGNHAEAVAPMTADVGARTLVVSTTEPYRAQIAADFDAFSEHAIHAVPLGPTQNRDVYLAVASGFEPVARDAEYMARLRQ